MIAESSGDSLRLTLEPFSSRVDCRRPCPNPKLDVPSRTTNTAVSVVHLPTLLAVKLRSFRFFGFIFHSPQCKTAGLRENWSLFQLQVSFQPADSSKLFI